MVHVIAHITKNYSSVSRHSSDVAYTTKRTNWHKNYILDNKPT